MRLGGKRFRRERRRPEHVVRVTAKVLQQTGRRAGSAGLVEPELACDGGLERRAEAILRATGEEMQVAPHEPQEAMRRNKRRFRER